MVNFKEIIGQRIRRRREIAGYSTQNDLAKALSIRQERVSGWETGKNTPRGKNRANLLKLLKVTEKELFSVEPEMKGPRLTPSETCSLLEPIFELGGLNPKICELVRVLVTGDASYWESLSESQRQHAQALLKALK